MKRKPLNKHSKVPLTKLKRLLLQDLEKAIRESGPCIMVGVEKACGGPMQASHILPRGAYPNLTHDPRNITPKCQTHHLYVWHRNIVHSGAWFQKKYAKQWEYLDSMKKTHFDWTPEKAIMLRTALKKSLAEYMDAYEDLRPRP